METECENAVKIQSLPYDIVVLFLEYTSITDILNFGATCKKFNELVKVSQSLWKQKLKNSVSRRLANMIEMHTDGNWFTEMKNITCLQSELHATIIEMTSYIYGTDRAIVLYEVRHLFDRMYSDGLLYYYSIEILQEFLRKATLNPCMQYGNKPFTLTEAHYTKSTLQHMMHPYMAIKWMQSQLVTDLPPELVLNFFIQWVDPFSLHSEEEVMNALNSMGSIVEKELEKKHSIPLQSIAQQCAKEQITEEEIVAAISHVIYKQKRINVMFVANLETLDIVNVIEKGRGHSVVIGAIFAALAKKFGVRCELICFTRHLFLEFRGTQNGVKKPVYRIDLETGQLGPKRSCPFSRNPNPINDCNYCPNSLLQFVASAYLPPLQSYKTWYCQNALSLLDFLNGGQQCDNKYKTYLPYLLENSHLPVLSAPVELTNLTEEQLSVISSLSLLTKPSPCPRYYNLVEHHRTSDIKFAVGMVLRHTKYHYVCVVLNWQKHGTEENPNVRNDQRLSATLPMRRGYEQPFYYVIAVDLSSRVVPQEQLKQIARPTRPYVLEDILGKEFTQFNGFAYEPNKYKAAEYPGDLAVSNRYRTLAECRSYKKRN